VGCDQQQNGQRRKMQLNCWQFLLQCKSGGMMQGTSPDGTHPVLHVKPLDAAIGRVPATHRHGRQICCKTQNTNNNQYF
jgi:hypothetical protein